MTMHDGKFKIGTDRLLKPIFVNTSKTTFEVFTPQIECAPVNGHDQRVITPENIINRPDRISDSFGNLARREMSEAC